VYDVQIIRIWKLIFIDGSLDLRMSVAPYDISHQGTGSSLELHIKRHRGRLEGGTTKVVFHVRK
jgi:hypothetical protein